MSPGTHACDQCLRRRWLVEILAPRLERERARIDDLLALEDAELMELLGGSERPGIPGDYAAFGTHAARRAREQASATGLELICAHAEGYPSGLRDLAALPAVLAVNGGADRLAELCAGEVVSVVGTRRATSTGTDTASAIARECSAVGVCVVSGMAFGIDSAAHLGALEAGSRTVVVLAGSAARPAPKARAALFRRVLAGGGVVISELDLPSVWRWDLQARNRLIAGLADMTVIVEAPWRSGALITARHAGALGRWVGVVPGAVTSPQSEGSNELLAKARVGTSVLDRASVIAVRGPQDVLDVLYGEGIIEVRDTRRPEPTAAESVLLARIRSGVDNATLIGPEDLVALAGLELKGWVVRSAGGALGTP